MAFDQEHKTAANSQTIVHAGGAHDPSGLDVIEFALNKRRAGHRVAMATLSAIHGSSPRALGAQMAVTQDGQIKGSISSGCLERAIVEEAQAALEKRDGRTVRYGAGSQYLDITLPCGSGMDILYTADLSVSALEKAFAAGQSRKPFALTFTQRGADFLGETVKKRGSRDSFTRNYHPPLQIAVAGVGVELILFTRMAAAAGYRINAFSPDAETIEQCAGTSALLTSTSSLPNIALDERTAFVSLFHDREWELVLLTEAMKSSPFYLGAVGSQKTSAERLEACRKAGADDAQLAKLKGPIGLIPATRDPSALAVSVLAEIVAAWPH